MSTKTIEWKIPTKDGASVSGVAKLTGTVTGPFNPEDDSEHEAKTKALSEYYDDDALAAADAHETANGTDVQVKKGQASWSLMPRSISTLKAGLQVVSKLKV